MLLKAAYFRLIGKSLTDPITFSDLNQAKGRANTLGIVWNRNLHDLPSWKNLLIEERKIRRAPYPPSFGVSLSARVANIHSNWRENLRYHVNRPRPGEVSSTFQAVAWLMANDSGL